MPTEFRYDVFLNRRALIETDLVDCMVALPGQLFYSTQQLIEALAA